MDNFNQVASDQLPQFLCKSVRKKAKLSVCQFTFKQNQKSNLLINRKKSFSHMPINPLIRNQSNQPTPINSGFSPIKYRSIHSIQATQQKGQKNPSSIEFILNQQDTQNDFGKDKNQGNLLSSFKFKFRSEGKLPILSKCCVQLNIEQSQQDKFIRIKKQASKIKLGKMHGNYGNYRQISQKNQILRVKEESHTENKEYEDNKNLSTSPSKMITIKDQQKQRCYFIRNLMLNAGNLQQLQNKQRASLNLLVHKLKQTQRRAGRLAPLQKKQPQQAPPNQLRTNKMHYEQASKNTMKEQIMKRFTKKIFKVHLNQENKGNQERKKQENYVSGWGHHAIQEHEEF